MKIEDVEGECNAHLYLGADCGEDHCTVRCNLKKGHDGPHQETFERNKKPVIILWPEDERE